MNPFTQKAERRDPPSDPDSLCPFCGEWNKDQFVSDFICACGRFSCSDFTFILISKEFNMFLKSSNFQFGAWGIYKRIFNVGGRNLEILDRGEKFITPKEAREILERFEKLQSFV